MTEQQAPDEIVAFTNVEQMGQMATDWHRTTLIKLARFAQLASEGGILIPTEELDADGEQVLKEGTADHNEGFLVGMQTALELLAEFPIKGHEVDESESQ